MVYPSEPAPLYVSTGVAVLISGHPTWRFEQVLRIAAQQTIPPTERERLAFDLFSGSQFEKSAAARLVTLVMAVETLLTPPNRSHAATAHVQRLIDATETEETLTVNERDSILGGLRWLLKESIRTSGRLPMRARLGARDYGGQDAEAIWCAAYTLRSRLAHGKTAPREEVERSAASMLAVVGDLLCGSLLEFEPKDPTI